MSKPETDQVNPTEDSERDKNGATRAWVGVALLVFFLLVAFSGGISRETSWLFVVPLIGLALIMWKGSGK